MGAKKKYTDEQKAEVRRLYADGRTRAEIAATLGVGLSSVTGWTRCQKSAPVAHREYDEATYREAMALHASGVSQAEIRRRLGVRRDALVGWIHLEKRPRSMGSDVIRPHAHDLKPGFEKLTPAKAYLLGVLCGDGCISKMGTGWAFALQVIDQDFVDEFVRCVAEVYGLTATSKRYVKKSSPRGWIIHSGVYSRRVCDDLVAVMQGLHRTEDWRIPISIWEIGEAEKGAFLRGFFDSEGGVYDGDLCAISTNPSGAEDIRALLESMGVSATCTVYGSQRIKEKPVWHVRVLAASKPLFEQKVGFTIARKRDRLRVAAERVTCGCLPYGPHQPKCSLYKRRACGCGSRGVHKKSCPEGAS